MSIFDCQYTSVVVTAGFDILSASNSRFSPSHLSSMLSIVLVLSIVVVVPVAPHILPGSVENFRFPIHVRNNGGEVFSEVITSNPSQNYISIDFEDTDGSHIKQLADFQNNISLFRVARLGEQDLSEQNVQVFCFVTRLSQHDFLQPDFMSKLTQKNPLTIRRADENQGSQLFQMDTQIILDRAALISPHLQTYCDTGEQHLYASQVDMEHWVSGNRNFSSISSALQKFWLKSETKMWMPQLNGTNSTNNDHVMIRCGEIVAKLYRKLVVANNNENVKRNEERLLEPCHCSLSLVVPWYVCGLRQCRSVNVDQVQPSYCGVRSCQRRYEFYFQVQDKLHCISDFDPTLNSNNSSLT